MTSLRLSSRAVLALSLFGCSSGLTLPDGTKVSCVDDSECPLDLHCAEAIGRCVSSRDATSPTMLSADALNEQNIALVFDEPLDNATAAQSSAYTFSPPLDVLKATPSDDGLTVRLVTAPQIGGAVYTAIPDVYDTSGNALDAATDKQFTGCCGTDDTTAPGILAPSDGVRLDGLSAVVAWTARRGAHRYTVRASIDPSFATPEVVIELDGNTTSTPLTVPTADSYYIEVKADTTLAAPVRVRAAFLNGVLRVYCAPDETCGDPQYAKAGGTIHDPIRRLGLAVSTATVLGIRRVEVASRGSLAYEETLILNNVAVDIAGGYAADFATRDPAVNVTTVDDTGLPHFFSGLTTSMTVSGLRFVNRPTNADYFSPMLQLNGCSDALVLDTCVFDQTTMAGVLNVFVNANGSVGAGPQIRRSVMSSLGAVEGADVLVGIASSPIAFDDCVFTLRTRGLSTGGAYISIRNSVLTRDVLGAQPEEGAYVSDATFENNVLRVRTGQSGTTALNVYGVATVRNNIILIDGGLGIDVDGSALVAHNTVLVTHGNGPALYTREPGTIIDNLLACADTSPATTGAEAQDQGSNPILPASYDANAVVGCARIFMKGPTSVTNLSTMNGASCGTGCEFCGGGCTAHFRDQAPALTSLASVFADFDGPDGNVRTLEDNDLHLGSGTDAAILRASGRSTFLDDCGPLAMSSCGAVAYDFDGGERNVPVSIGADE